MRYKTTDISQWHSHFTWVPTKIKGEWVWMERVLRRGWPQKSASTHKRWIDWEYLNDEFELMKLQEEKNQGGQVMTEAQQSSTLLGAIANKNFRVMEQKNDLTEIFQKRSDLVNLTRKKG